MRILREEELPYSSKEFKFHLDSDIISRFHKAFRWNTSSIPPTLAARAFVGMFDLLNFLEVDWKKLLHTSQSFEYLAPLEEGQELLAQSKLVKWRKRSGMHWLQFDSLLSDTQNSRVLLRGQSLILVEDS